MVSPFPEGRDLGKGYRRYIFIFMHTLENSNELSMDNKSNKA